MIADTLKFPRCDQDRQGITIRKCKVSKTFSYGLIFSALVGACQISTSKAQAQAYVSLKDYVFASYSGGSLCTSNFSQCMTSAIQSDGEKYDFYAFSTGGSALITWTARTTGNGVNGGYYIGVVRDYNNYTLRCFSNPGQLCYAPPNSDYLPSGIPEFLNLPIASGLDDFNASNDDGTPRTLINGSQDITGPQTFWVNTLDPNTCAQTLHTGEVGNQVFAIYVQSLDFGGDVKVQDALVIQEVETAYVNGVRNSYPDHIERYYYVRGLGRVREATASYDTGTGQFTITQHNNPVRNTFSTSAIQAPNWCPQGTAAY